LIQYRFYPPPISGLFRVAFFLCSRSLMGGFGDSFVAMRLKELSGVVVDVCLFHWRLRSIDLPAQMRRRAR
jgi:hypothetical protein